MHQEYLYLIDQRKKANNDESVKQCSSQTLQKWAASLEIKHVVSCFYHAVLEKRSGLKSIGSCARKHQDSYDQEALALQTQVKEFCVT